ncbi:hypothetical protein ACXZ7R_19595 [Vibrio campbellii]
MRGDKGVNQVNHVLGVESSRLDSKSRDYSKREKALLLHDNRVGLAYGAFLNMSNGLLRIADFALQVFALKTGRVITKAKGEIREPKLPLKHYGIDIRLLPEGSACVY